MCLISGSSLKKFPQSTSLFLDSKNQCAVQKLRKYLTMGLLVHLQILDWSNGAHFKVLNLLALTVKLRIIHVLKLSNWFVASACLVTYPGPFWVHAHTFQIQKRKKDPSDLWMVREESPYWYLSKTKKYVQGSYLC